MTKFASLSSPLSLFVKNRFLRGDHSFADTSPKYAGVDPRTLPLGNFHEIWQNDKIDEILRRSLVRVAILSKIAFCRATTVLKIHAQNMQGKTLGPFSLVGGHHRGPKVVQSSDIQHFAILMKFEAPRVDSEKLHTVWCPSYIQTVGLFSMTI